MYSEKILILLLSLILSYPKKLYEGPQCLDEHSLHFHKDIVCFFSKDPVFAQCFHIHSHWASHLLRQQHPIFESIIYLVQDKMHRSVGIKWPYLFCLLEWFEVIFTISFELICPVCCNLRDILLNQLSAFIFFLSFFCFTYFETLISMFFMCSLFHNWVIVVLHSVPYFLALRKNYYPPPACPVIYLHRLVRYVIKYFILSPSVCLVSILFSQHSFRLTSSKSFLSVALIRFGIFLTLTCLTMHNNFSFNCYIITSLLIVI